MSLTDITQENELLNFREAQTYLRISRSTLYRFMEAGKIKGYKLGSTWRFWRNDLVALVQPERDNPLLHRPLNSDLAIVVRKGTEK